MSGAKGGSDEEKGLPFHTVAGATPMKQKTLRNLEKGTLQAAKYTGSQCGCRKKYSVLDLAAEP